MKAKHIILAAIVIILISAGGLAFAGQTVIQGDRIFTGTITAARLFISSFFRLDTLSSPPLACSAANEGLIYADSAKGLCYCDGSRFQCISGTAGAQQPATCQQLPGPIRLAFVSSAAYSGNLGGIDGANQKCNGLAKAANLTGTWRAWVSTSTVSAKTNIGCSEEKVYLSLDGRGLAFGCSDLTDGSLNSLLSVTENLVKYTYSDFYGTSGGEVWTGTVVGGYGQGNSGQNCRDWTSSSGNDFGSWGWVIYSDYRWTHNGVDSRYVSWNDNFCSLGKRLYCFQL